MLNLAVYLHRLDPVALHITDGIAIRWYGLSYLLAFFLGYLLILMVVKRGISTLKPQEVGDLVVCLALGVVIGGRLGYVFFYKPSLLWQFDSSIPWWGVLKINQGGMASHGGMIGGILASLYYTFRHKHSYAHILDLFAFGAPLGLFFGRCANFINGELYGRPMQKVMPWAVKFPLEMERWFPPRHPERWDPNLLGVVREATRLLPPEQRVVDPDLQADALVAAIYRGNETVIRAIEPVLASRHPSQLYEALLEGLLLAIILILLWRRPRKPLVVAGAFGLVYGLVRIFGECFRVPDEHLGFPLLNLTQGQLLSIPLAIAGLTLILVGSRRNVPKMGGWAEVKHE